MSAPQTLLRCVLAFALALVQEPEALAQQTFLLSGRVVSAETGAPLRGVRVGPPGLAAASSRSDAEGWFQLEVAGRAMLTLSKAGFARQNVAVTGAGPVEVRMARGAAITVYVVDASGRPVAGTTVNVRCPNGGRGVTTDDRGQARVGGLAEGRCEVNAPDVGPLIQFKGIPMAELLAAAREEIARLLPARIQAQRGSANVVEVRAGDDTAVVALDSGTAVVPALAVAGRPRGETGTGEIHGRVLTADGRPVAGAQVLLRGASGDRVVTDEAGAYAFAGLLAGRFRVGATRPPAFVMSEFGQVADSPRGTEIVLEPGQRLSGVDIILRHGGVITGVVFDEYGEPVEEAFVQVSAAPTGGPTSPGGASMVRTDDRGYYRTSALPPGAYNVGVSLRAPGTGEIVFYPGVLNRTEATLVPVALGQESPRIDISLSASLGSRLTGLVVDAGGNPVSRGRALLVPTARRGSSGNARTAPVNAAGEFAFINVPPGEYQVSVTVPPAPYTIVTRRNGQPVDGPPVPRTEYGRTTVAVQGTARTTVVTRPGATIAGRARFEGDRPVAPATFRLGAIDGAVAAVPVGPDGTYELRGLSVPTRLALVSAPAGWWLESFSVDGVDAADEPYDFGAAAGRTLDAVAVLAPTSRVSGRIVDDSGGRFAEATVVAFPLDRTRWYERSQYVVTSRPDSAGRYQIEVPPGAYLVVAVTARASTDADSLSALEGLATTVIAVEGQAIEQDLRPTVPPR